ncbi:MAG: kinase-like domain-containing protein [Monoraphidium minutum]|nr:MAG: kinase-like domain-containing protein [Monoraphidium minutum]
MEPSSRFAASATVQDFLEHYEVGDTVGVGGFAVVKRGRDKVTGEQVAIKVVDKSRYAAGDNSLEREIQVLCKVDHPNCIKLYAVYITQRKVYIVTELVTGGELLDRVTEKGNYTEKDAANLIRQILSGVAYLHGKGIVHRDLKLENMVMLNERDDSPVKIADFGLSKFFSADNVLSTMCGSPQYVAPEVLGVGDGVKEYSPAVDMWSVGVILFILLSGYSPFDDDNDAVLFEKIKSGNYDDDDPIWETVSPEGKDIVGQLLTVDAANRLSAEEALRHPWVAGQVFEGDEGKGRQQLQSTTDKLKTMAVKRESMRQQSFKQAADGGNGPPAAGAAAAAGAGAPTTLHEGVEEGE